MKILKNKKVPSGSIVDVEWLDAAAKTGEAKDEVISKKPRELCVVVHTYGIYEAEDDIAIRILQETSETNVDYTVIPKGMILKITKLKSK